MSRPSHTGARDLRLLATAGFLSAAGDMLALITLALVVHDLTHSGLAVSAFSPPRWFPWWRWRRSPG